MSEYTMLVVWRHAMNSKISSTNTHTHTQILHFSKIVTVDRYRIDLKEYIDECIHGLSITIQLDWKKPENAHDRSLLCLLNVWDCIGLLLCFCLLMIIITLKYHYHTRGHDTYQTPFFLLLFGVVFVAAYNFQFVRYTTTTIMTIFISTQLHHMFNGICLAFGSISHVDGVPPYKHNSKWALTVCSVVSVFMHSCDAYVCVRSIVYYTMHTHSCSHTLAHNTHILIHLHNTADWMLPVGGLLARLFGTQYCLYFDSVQCRVPFCVSCIL